MKKFELRQLTNKFLFYFWLFIRSNNGHFIWIVISSRICFSRCVFWICLSNLCNVKNSFCKYCGHSKRSLYSCINFCAQYYVLLLKIKLLNISLHNCIIHYTIIFVYKLVFIIVIIIFKWYFVSFMVFKTFILFLKYLLLLRFLSQLFRISHLSPILLLTLFPTSFSLTPSFLVFFAITSQPIFRSSTSPPYINMHFLNQSYCVCLITS